MPFSSLPTPGCDHWTKGQHSAASAPEPPLLPCSALCQLRRPEAHHQRVPTPAGLGALHDQVRQLPHSPDLCPFARAGFGTPELGLTRTSQGEAGLIREAQRPCREENWRLSVEPRGMETRPGGPRGQARRTGLCVHVCLRARHRLLSIPGDKQERPAATALERPLADSVPGLWVPAALSGKMGWGLGLSTHLMEATGPRPGPGSSVVPL